MTSGEIIIAAFLAFVSAGLGTLFWSRLNRIEVRLERVEEALAKKADKSEIAELRAELAKKAEKSDIAELRAELASQRSDLTQIALAVGARRPRASEG